MIIIIDQALLMMTFYRLDIGETYDGKAEKSDSRVDDFVTTHGNRDIRL